MWYNPAMPRTKLPRDEEGNIIRDVPVVNESPEEVNVEVNKVRDIASDVFEAQSKAESTKIDADVASKGTATVKTLNGNVIRVYSKEIHGEDFHDLAKQMQAQHSDSTIELT